MGFGSRTVPRLIDETLLCNNTPLFQWSTSQRVFQSCRQEAQIMIRQTLFPLIENRAMLVNTSTDSCSQ
jgi:hypothetical protein